MRKESEHIIKLRKSLDEAVFGLEKAKETLMQYEIARMSNPKIRHLCFLGSPGTGKATLARAFAKATSRKFGMLPLGAIRKTEHVDGARPESKIVKLIKSLNVDDPVIFIETVDQIASRNCHEIHMAILNIIQRDEGVNEPNIFKKVTFIFSINEPSRMPYAFFKSVQLIEITSYIEDEKVKICSNFVIPTVCKSLSEKPINIPTATIRYIIKGFTMEPGVGELQDRIEQIVRSVKAGACKSRRITIKDIDFILGAPYPKQKTRKKRQYGKVMGLAWNGCGGDTLPVEVALCPGPGTLIITGRASKVMTESAVVAFTYAKEQIILHGKNLDWLGKTDVHVHFPDTATPKDGPSAGIAICLAITSMLLGMPVKSDYAMTGELSLKGDVLPIGGLDEKVAAAVRAGIRNVIVPKSNLSELGSIRKKILDRVNIIPVDHIFEVFNMCLINKEAGRSDGGK